MFAWTSRGFKSSRHTSAQAAHGQFTLGSYLKCQLHTTRVGAVGWEPHGSSPTTCAGKADHGFGVCVPLASSLSFENGELNNNYSPIWRWLVVVNEAAKRRGKYHH